jgi:hypothetical protein
MNDRDGSGSIRIGRRRGPEQAERVEREAQDQRECGVFRVFRVFRPGRDGAEPGIVLWVALTLLAVETVVFMGNGMKCPLTALAMRYGAEKGNAFDTFLPSEPRGTRCGSSAR